MKKNLPIRGLLFLFFFIPAVFFFNNICAATKTWTGLAGDNNWSSSANWDNNIIPASSDDVVLDNSVKSGSYIVNLPATSVTIKTLTITPSGNNIIQLILPSTNTQVPAFTATGPGYALVINRGGIFKNSSGATSGITVVISDSIRINNGGKYVHNTQRSHTTNVAVLSRTPGTENGIFEFDVPGTPSYSVSMSNRTYGNLILSATAAGGSRNYFCTGTNTLNVNGNFQLNTGVNFNMQLGGADGNIVIKGSYIQNGGTLNLSSADGNSTIVKIAGDIAQAASSLITETNSGARVIELNGLAQQNISLQGTISNSVILRINNTSGAVLQAPVSLPYKLDLMKGNITTSSVNLLTLQAGANISADTTISNISFINGPLRKEGLSSTNYFLFPVGKPNEFRWLELKNATGNFSIEFFASDARNLSTSYGSGIDHISSHGYWEINVDASPAASAKVELSFANASGSGVTDMATLRASQLSSGVWIDRNNTSTTGTPGAAGSVVSETISTFNSTAKNFVLASSVSNENPLPVVLASFTAIKESDAVKLSWDAALANEIDYFEIWSANDSNDFKKIDVVKTAHNKENYEFEDKEILNGIRYYKLQIVLKSGDGFFSKIISIKDIDNSFKILSLVPSVIHNNATIVVNANERAQLQFIITNMNGQMIGRRFYAVEKGKNSITLGFSELASGIYLLSCIDGKGNIATIKFIRI